MPFIKFTWLPLAVLLALQLHLAGCASPSYYAQAVSGHLELMRKRQDVDALLQDAQTDNELAEDLETAKTILKFGFEELGLKDSGNFQQYAATGQKAVTWLVVAAPEFSLQPRRWCFLVSGCVPYRGYFQEASARKFAEKLGNKGYDVSVTPATAYSTLGWFDDPLLDTMFQSGEARLAAVLIHEMAHQQLYVKGDTAFNEAFASFVEEIGVERWLAYRGKSTELTQWKNMKMASLDLNRLLLRFREQLAELYSREMTDQEMRWRKQDFFNALASEYEALVAGGWHGVDYFGGINPGLNNAGLALIASYRGGACAFESLYREAGADMARFLELSAQQAGLDRDARSAWLRQPCTVIASSSDL